MCSILLDTTHSVCLLPLLLQTLLLQLLTWLQLSLHMKWLQQLALLLLRLLQLILRCVLMMLLVLSLLNRKVGACC